MHADTYIHTQIHKYTDTMIERAREREREREKEREREIERYIYIYRKGERQIDRQTNLPVFELDLFNIFQNTGKLLGVVHYKGDGCGRGENPNT